MNERPFVKQGRCKISKRRACVNCDVPIKFEKKIKKESIKHKQNGNERENSKPNDCFVLNYFL